MPTALLYTAGVVVFALAMLASIGLHELGHMIPAKAFGGKVTQYFIGFGPTVWSRRTGETEWGLKAIPLGGYVKIVGMLPPEAEDLADEVTVDEDGNRVLKVRRSSTGLFTQLISDARAAEWEHVQPGDEDRLFYRLPWWKKVVVMAGGPTVNILIAFVIFASVFAAYGNPSDQRVGVTIDRVAACVVPLSDDGRVCKKGDQPTPAREMGLKVGDRMLSVDGHRISGWTDVQRLVRANGTRRATIVVDRNGRRLTFHHRLTVRPPQKSGEKVDKRIGYLGVEPTAVNRTGGPLYTIGQMGVMTKDVVGSLATLPVKVYRVGQAILGLRQRDPNGPVSIVGGGRFAGEAAADKSIDLRDKLVSLLLIIAGFNFFIGMFNFVPLLPLDGGHIASALWEAGRRGLARLRRRPDPGYVDAAKLLPIAYVVAVAMLVMGLVLVVADFVVPVHIA